jgi:hypothetical protein
MHLKEMLVQIPNVQLNYFDSDDTLREQESHELFAQKKV